MNRLEQERNTEFRRITRLQRRLMEQHPDQPQHREARSDPQHKGSQQQESGARSPQVCRYYRLILLVIFKLGMHLVSRNHLHAEYTYVSVYVCAVTPPMVPPQMVWLDHLRQILLP